MPDAVVHTLVTLLFAVQSKTISVRSYHMVSEIPCQQCSALDFALLCCARLAWQDVRVPAAFSGAAWAKKTIAVGGSGSGYPAHRHDHAATVLLFGRKRWFIFDDPVRVPRCRYFLSQDP